jgi:hypothetical protein
MKYLIVTLFSAANLALLSSCQTWKPSVTAVKLDTNERVPTSRVDIYLDRSQVKRQFKEVGLIVAKEGEWDAYYGLGNEAKLIDMIKTKAMSIGADGIVLLGNDQKMRPGATVGYAFANSQGGYLTGVSGYGETSARASAIIYVR